MNIDQDGGKVTPFILAVTIKRELSIQIARLSGSGTKQSSGS